MNSPNTKSTYLENHPLLLDLRERKLRGHAFSNQNSLLMDELLSNLTAQHLFTTPTIALLALGGYGREELCPHSDIDIMFLTDGTSNELQSAAIEKFLYALWDHGLKVGHSVRGIEDCKSLAKKDSKILTSLLDARLVSGKDALYKELSSSMETLLSPEEKRNFVQDKLAERDERHKKYGDTRYVLEPNIKEGKGGLRDFQTLMWIARALFGCRTLDDLVKHDILTSTEAQRFAKSHDFLLTVRCHLHDIAGRSEERLHFDIQPSLPVSNVSRPLIVLKSE